MEKRTTHVVPRVVLILFLALLALACTPAQEAVRTAKQANQIGPEHYVWGSPDLVSRYGKQSLPLFLTAGDRSTTGAMFNNLGLAYLDFGDQRRARHYLETALELFRDEGGQTAAIINLGALWSEGRLASGTPPLFDSALDKPETLREKALEASSLNALGRTFASIGDRDRALESYNSALAEYRAMGDFRGEGEVLRNIGMLSTSKTK